eukprot:Pompholyxophrys_punicea_v1_NODE_1080_length_980_cov_2.245405.p1 type:complete len:177 gc:universal NODE_1080_length_980_cov_2.245405:577-47(-)
MMETQQEGFLRTLTVAECTNFDENLISKLSAILILVNRPQAIHSKDKFKEFCLETYKGLTTKYAWYYLPSGVHRLLRHSWELMEDEELANFPLSLWSEEASESCNKLYRNSRLQFARKNNRRNNLEDILHRRLVASDPKISMILSNKQQKAKKLKISKSVEDILNKVVHFLCSFLF